MQSWIMLMFKKLLVLLLLSAPFQLSMASVEDVIDGANSGKPSSQFILGVSYESGRGVSQDYAQAVHWFTKSANQGHSLAQFSLAEMYYQGKGVQQDYGQAFAWHSKAADQNLSLSQGRLGKMYNLGHGVNQDYPQSFSWYMKAAVNNDADAQYNVGLMYKTGLGVAQDYNQAQTWLSRATAKDTKPKRAALGPEELKNALSVYDELHKEINKQKRWSAFWHISGYAAASLALGGLLFSILLWNNKRIEKSEILDISISLEIPISEINNTENSHRLERHLAEKYTNGFRMNRLADLCGWILIFWNSLGFLSQSIFLVAVIWYTVTDELSNSVYAWFGILIQLFFVISASIFAAMCLLITGSAPGQPRQVRNRLAEAIKQRFDDGT